MEIKIKKNIKTVCAAVIILAIAAVVIYNISLPLSTRLKWKDVTGEKLYEYSYSESGTATVLYDEDKGTITFVDTNVMGRFNISGVRGCAVYNTQTEETESIYGFDDFENQYLILTDYREKRLQIGIPDFKVVGGVPELNHLYLGIYKDQPQTDTLYEKEIGDSFLAVSYAALQ